jgi:ketol-acid reductoisomerase
LTANNGLDRIASLLALSPRPCSSRPSSCDRLLLPPCPRPRAPPSRSPGKILQKYVFLADTPHKTVPARGVKTLNFAGSDEVVYERSDWPLAKLHDYFKNDTLALIGYGSQGHGQGLNARDNGLNVIVGVRKDGESWKQALEDGWVSPFPPRLPSFSPVFIDTR